MTSIIFLIVVPTILLIIFGWKAMLGGLIVFIATLAVGEHLMRQDETWGDRKSSNVIPFRKKE